VPQCGSQEAIEINPNYTDALNNRAFSYFQLKEYDKAWEDLRKAEKLGSVANHELIRALKQVTGTIN
jgi:Tfp pilus assembly protein PilF